MSQPEQRQYPIGKFQPKEKYTPSELSACIDLIGSLPEKIEAVASTRNAKLMDASYREGGWSARQVIHHLADSHMNAYIRVKWTLTENSPTIKAYNEKAWAETSETALDPHLSITLLHALHAKWVAVLKGLTSDDLQKHFVHPETHKEIRLDRMIAMYAWHGEHHLAHLNLILTSPQ
jgi:hypothetical protein